MNVIHIVVVIGVIGAGGEEIVTMIEWDTEAITIAIMDMVEVLTEVEMEVVAELEAVLTEVTTTSRQGAFNLNVLFSRITKRRKTDARKNAMHIANFADKTVVSC